MQQILKPSRIILGMLIVECPSPEDKVCDDLVIKYSRDFIDGSHEWKSKANRKVAAELKVKEDAFNQNQKNLMCQGIDKEDAAKLATGNRIIRCYCL